MERLGADEIEGRSMDRGAGADTDGRCTDRGAGAETLGRCTDRGAGAETLGRCTLRGDGDETLGRCTLRGDGDETLGRCTLRGDGDETLGRCTDRGGGDETLGRCTLRGDGDETRVCADGALRGALTRGELSRLGRFRVILGVLLRGDGVETRGEGADSRGAIVRFCGTEEIRGDSVRDGSVVPIRDDPVRFEGVETLGVVRDRSVGAGVREMPDREEFDSDRLGVVERAMLRLESGWIGVCDRDCTRDGRLIEPREDRSRVCVRADGVDRSVRDRFGDASLAVARDRSVFRVTREKSGWLVSCGCRLERVNER
jgi:hypothetical protein